MTTSCSGGKFPVVVNGREAMFHGEGGREREKERDGIVVTKVRIKWGLVRCFEGLKGKVSFCKK